MSKQIVYLGVNGEDWVAELITQQGDVCTVKRPLRIGFVPVGQNSDGSPNISLQFIPIPPIFSAITDKEEVIVKPSIQPLPVVKQIENSYLSAVSGIAIPEPTKPSGLVFPGR